MVLRALFIRITLLGARTRSSYKSFSISILTTKLTFSITPPKQQASSLEEAAASIKELTPTIKQNADVGAVLLASRFEPMAGMTPYTIVALQSKAYCSRVKQISQTRTLAIVDAGNWAEFLVPGK